MGTLQRVGAGLLALTLVGGIAACGDDDDDTTTETTAEDASGDTTAFCDSLVEFNTAVNEVEIDESASEEDVKAAGEQLAPLFAVIVTNAPEEVSDAADELNTVVQALLEGNAEEFNSEATSTTYSGLLDGAIGTCGFETVAVEAEDYAFDAPDTMPAGTISFALTNTSDAEPHEMLVLQKVDGVDLTWDEILSLSEEEVQSKTRFVTATFAAPGESGSALTSLTAGDYVMICTLPVGGAEDGPPHLTQGMIHEFTVE